jgi:hypothetical protein
MVPVTRPPVVKRELALRKAVRSASACGPGLKFAASGASESSISEIVVGKTAGLPA